MQKNVRPAVAKRMSELSILIPTYNDICVNLVCDLQRCCMRVQNLTFEIIVADDGSTSEESIASNKKIGTIGHCRHIIRNENVGRAAIRNFLAQNARYDKLLFIDSHMSVISDDFILRYLSYADNHSIVYGGYTIPKEVRAQPSNLRWKYETHCLHLQSAETRSQEPYANFHTSNFLISKEVMLSHPLDERFKHYGYEDVLFGKTLLQAGIPILHIDNPVGFCRFESNERFVSKTEESIQTLHNFNDELIEYSRLAQLADRLRSLHLQTPLRFLFRLLSKSMRQHLTGQHPTLPIFNLYKLCYLLSSNQGDRLFD